MMTSDNKKCATQAHGHPIPCSNGMWVCQHRLGGLWQCWPPPTAASHCLQVGYGKWMMAGTDDNKEWAPLAGPHHNEEQLQDHHNDKMTTHHPCPAQRATACGVAHGWNTDDKEEGVNEVNEVNEVNKVGGVDRKDTGWEENNGGAGMRAFSIWAIGFLNARTEHSKNRHCSGPRSNFFLCF